MQYPNPLEIAANPHRLTISVKEFCQLSGMGKTKTNALIREGRLAVTRVGRRTLISYDSAVALITPERSIYAVCSDSNAPRLSQREGGE